MKLKCVLVELNEQRNVNRKANVPLVITHTLNYSFYPRNFFHILWSLTNTWFWEWYLYIKYCHILHFTVKKKNNELIPIIFDISNVLFPKSYVPKCVYSQVLVFPVPNIPKAPCSHILYSQGLMFPSSYVPKILCFKGPMFPMSVPRSYVQKVPSCWGPMFPFSSVPKILCSPVEHSDSTH